MTIDVRTKPLLTAECAAEGWAQQREHPYCPTHVELPDGKLVTKTPIAMTADAVYGAWEPVAGHSTLTSIAGRWYGQIGTRPLPPELEALPAGSDMRIAAVGTWHDDQYAEAVEVILRAFPGREFRSSGMGSLTAAI